MKKLALALATTAALGFAAPALAADTDMSGTKAQTQAPAGQTTHQRRHSTHLARHDRGFKHGHYYAYVKPHHKSVHHRKTMTQH